jgi:zinc D-Ala-D-Ala dipeptidase
MGSASGIFVGPPSTRAAAPHRLISKVFRGKTLCRKGGRTRILQKAGNRLPALIRLAAVPSFLILLVLAMGFRPDPCVTDQPCQRGFVRDLDLVEIVRLDATFRLDIRYAGRNNFLGYAVYPEARAFLQRPAAEALVRVHERLKRQGYGLLIFDAYRPWSVTKLFWDETPAEKRNFVADPKKGSRHNRGCAVDLTLFGLETGEEVAMPSGYDEFSERAYRDYGGGTDESRRLRDLLRHAMETQGFTVNRFEWWHFDYKDWESYPILDLSFSEIGKAHR